jgi:hypothetical protein
MKLKRNASTLTRVLGALSTTVVVVAACSNSNPTPDGGSDAGNDVANDGGSCTLPGQATPGPADMHCTGQPVQMTNEGDCFVDAGPVDDAGTDAGDAGPTDTCDYGDTMFGYSGDDDDCKYHVVWSSTPICETSVTFTVTVTYLGNNAPVTGIPQGVLVEPFIPTVADAACDNKATHISPSSFNPLPETPPGSGTYVGPVVFDAPGDWTLRFHIHEECSDDFDDSPHGHAAFHITVP